MNLLESIYLRTQYGSALFAGFGAAFLIFLWAVSARSDRARRLGLWVMGLSSAGLVGAFAVRWILTGRPWYLPPVMNQFEAVFASAMLAGLLGMGLEIAWKKNFFAIAGSLYATAALLATLIFAGKMGLAITAEHGILDHPIMAAHVVVIIIGHTLAGMTFFISLAYLGVCVGNAHRPPGQTEIIIDRCNLVVAQLACWMIFLGVFLGAVWADRAWGRWWGWDAKETWALITAIIYLAIPHVRRNLLPRRQGLATAVLCMLGCLAMLFNWIVVNYFLTGLHSYA